MNRRGFLGKLAALGGAVAGFRWRRTGEPTQLFGLAYASDEVMAESSLSFASLVQTVGMRGQLEAIGFGPPDASSEWKWYTRVRDGESTQPELSRDGIEWVEPTPLDTAKACLFGSDY